MAVLSRRAGLGVCLAAAAWLAAATARDATAGTAAAGSPAESPAAPSAAELELSLARKTAPYLVIDLAAGTVSVRLRGRSLQVVPLDGFQVLRRGALGGPVEPLRLPEVWQVARRPPTRRVLHLPTELVAHDEAESTPSAPAESAPPPPESYAVVTRQGWMLEIGAAEQTPGRLQLLFLAVADGWRSWRGRQTAKPPRLVLQVAPEAAASLHHLFRPDLPVLVVGGGAGPAQPAAGSP